jgi:hypothetical protein
MMGLLCSIIRETGASDSAAAARASVHPSTVSRWKRDNFDFAILLRAAREDFRHAQLSLILGAAQAGGATGLRAAMWLLERVFPEDYAPRARERAQFQEQFEAGCAREEEGSEIAPPDGGKPLQNVQNSGPLAPPALNPAATSGSSPETPRASLEIPAFPDSEAAPPAAVAEAGGLAGLRFPSRPLQNVRNSPLTGPVCPPILATPCLATEERWG